MDLSNVFVLLVVFQAKHFLADYPLQGSFMLGKFKADWGFLKPLASHCLVHSFFTFFIAIVFNGDSLFALKLSALDFVVHFAMDRIKAGPKYLGRFKPLTAGEYKDALLDLVDVDKKKEANRKIRNNKLFWWALGVDQTVHHLTHYAIIYLMVTK